MPEQLNIKGVIKGVEITKAPPGASWKRRASIILVTNAGKTYMSTFDENAIKKAQELTGDNAIITFTKSKCGKYNNIVGTGVNAINEINVVEESIDDPVEDDGAEPNEPQVSTKPVRTTPRMVNNVAYDRDSFWANKEQRDIENSKKIIRQNSWTQALRYIEQILKATELGLIHKDGFDSEDLKLESVTNVAHQIEADINRVKDDEHPESN